MQKIKNVQPLKTPAEIDDMKWALEKYCSSRDKFMFVFGINTGLRVSDIVKLKVKDVRGKTHLMIKETKTKKTKRFSLSPNLRKEIDAYTRLMQDGDWLFPSRNKNGKGSGHISTTQAYRVLTKAGDMLGRDDIGTHTMRKTFGYAYYRKTKDIAFLQDIFNHSSPNITKRYIGITQEEIDKTLEDFYL